MQHADIMAAILIGRDQVARAFDIARATDLVWSVAPAPAPAPADRRAAWDFPSWSWSDIHAMSRLRTVVPTGRTAEWADVA